jgi:uncharacterized coiled-coil DUF342 family protein
MSQIDYLESERVKLWDKVNELENDIKKKSSDYEKESRNHSKQASEYRNKCEASMNLASRYASKASEKLESIDTLFSKIDELNGNISSMFSEAEENNNSITEYLSNVSEKKDIIETRITQLEEIFENSDNYIEQLETLNNYFEEGEVVDSKINLLHKSILIKKKEIDEIHREINGYTEASDEEGEDGTYIEGLKDKLEISYDEIKKNLGILSETIKTSEETAITNYKKLIEEKDSEFNSSHGKWEKEYATVLEKITGLLPKALTAGLSYAYSEKKEAELEDSEKLAKKFRTATYGLVAVSLIPFVISIISWINNKELQQLIMDMPRLVLAILPLYIPVMWLAYSANKKLNLSKRLIEEYTHKEVLSKTFEGLSTQADKITNNGMSADLRNKLLYNLISVSSENPGKLISDYNKSDHPLTDTLEKSVQLANAVEKLADIPGFNKITTMINNKSKKIIDSSAQKINDGLDLIVEVENKEDNLN